MTARIGGMPGGGDVQRLRQRFGIERVVNRIDIEQQRRGPRHLDGRDRGDGGVGDGDDRAARAYAETTQCQGDRVGAVAAADDGRHTQPGREFRLERADFVAEDIPA